MSIENSQVIDAISTSPQDVVVLTISDHLEWDDQNAHLLLLQNKINAYLEVIENGEIFEIYPEAHEKTFQIGIAFKFSPNETAIAFLKRVGEFLTNSGYALDYYVLSE